MRTPEHTFLHRGEQTFVYKGKREDFMAHGDYWWSSLIYWQISERVSMLNGSKDDTANVVKVSPNVKSFNGS